MTDAKQRRLPLRLQGVIDTSISELGFRWKPLELPAVTYADLGL